VKRPRWLTPGERLILARLDEIEDQLRKQGEQMDAAGEALKTSIDAVAAEESQTHEAVVAAGTKFTELKEKIEHTVATGALSDEEATALTTLANETTTHLTEATNTLKAETEAA
jgi:hypothetical protein